MAGPFPLDDRHELLFGRKPDIDHLTARSHTKGVTVVVGRPKLGKTWLLQQMAGRLDTESDALVGYHECKGETADLLLRAVSDLYTRWLSDSGNWEQAKLLWARHKDSFTAGAGQAFGRVVEGLSGLWGWTPKIVGSKIREGFDALATAASDLTSGGLTTFRPLSYDQALELFSIVSAVSGHRPLVLVLDAWEKTLSFEAEKKTLDTVLSNLTDLAAVPSICRCPPARVLRRAYRQSGTSTRGRPRGGERGRRALRASADAPRRAPGTGADAGVHPSQRTRRR